MKRKRFITKVIQACSLMKMENGRNYQILFIFPFPFQKIILYFLETKAHTKINFCETRGTKIENFISHRN